METISFRNIILQAALLLLSGTALSEVTENKADIYLTFKPSNAITVNFEQQDRFIWKADEDTYFYSPLALPYLHREQKIEGHLCFDLTMKSKAFEQAIRQKLGNLTNKAKLEMVPVSGITLSLYKRGTLYPDPIVKSYKFPSDVSYQKPTHENICLPVGEDDLKELDNIEVRTFISVRYVNQAESSCSIIAAADKSLYQIKYADSQGNEKLVDEAQINDAVKEKLISFSYQCRSEKGEEISRPGGFSPTDKSALLTNMLSQLETDFVKWSDLNSKVNEDLINEIPVEDLEYTQKHSNETVTVEELASNVGPYILNRILQHNKLPAMVNPASDKKANDLNTKTTTNKSGSESNRKVKIPGGLNFVSLKKYFDSQRIEYTYSDIAELGLLDSQLDPLHGPFTRNSERKYSDTPFDSNFPNKVIMAYYGDLAKLPDNWTLCNGSEVSNNSGGKVKVPNLAGRYLKGVNETDGVLNEKGGLPIIGKMEYKIVDAYSLKKSNPSNPPIAILDRGIRINPPEFVKHYSHLLSPDDNIYIAFGRKFHLFSNTIKSDEPPVTTVHWICRIY